MLAAELTNRYSDGFLPSQGGWLDQDHFYVSLIQAGLQAMRERERIEERKKSIKSKARRH